MRLGYGAYLMSTSIGELVGMDLWIGGINMHNIELFS